MSTTRRNPNKRDSSGTAIVACSPGRNSACQVDTLITYIFIVYAPNHLKLIEKIHYDVFNALMPLY